MIRKAAMFIQHFKAVLLYISGRMGMTEYVDNTTIRTGIPYRAARKFDI